MPLQSIVIEGKNIVISGNLFYFFNHEELKNKLEASGAKVSRRISGKTDILIVGEAGTTGRVQDIIAEEQGISILLESDITPFL